MIRAVGWSLLRFVWPGAAGAALLASLNLLWRRSAPQLRYLLATATLLLMLLLPALTFRVVRAAADSVGPTAGPGIPVGEWGAWARPRPGAAGRAPPVSRGRDSRIVSPRSPAP